MLTDRPSPRGDEAELYRRYAERLVRLTAHRVKAPHALIEDACALAWLQLLRTQPERGPAIFAWLRTVALHEAYALSRRQRRDAWLEELGGESAEEDGEPRRWEETLPGPGSVEHSLEARRALAVLSALPARERRYLVLRVAGYRYQEICQLTGATYTNVNKHLTRARGRIRAQEAEA